MLEVIVVPTPQAASRSVEASWSADRERILEIYLGLLSASDNPLATADGTVRAQLTAQLYGTVDAVAAELGLAGERPTGDDLAHDNVSAAIGRDRAKSAVHPSHSLQAAALIFDATLPVFIERAATAGRPCAFTDIASALNREILTRMGEAARSYVEHLLTVSANGNRDERRRLSRELHDVAAPAVAQSLRNLELHDIYQATEPALAAEKLNAARVAMRDASTTIRALSAQTRATVAADGLVAAIERFLDTVPAGICTDVRLDNIVAELPLPYAEEAFLIVREAIRNAVAHAEPAEITVRISTGAARVVMSVRDDGIGFDPALARSECVGISAMHERAELLGADLTIRSVPQAGSVVELCIPLPNSRELASPHLTAV